MSAPALVLPSEADLLTLARHLIAGAPYAQLERLLTHSREAPRGLTPSALRVLEETLAVGATLMLARGGGWRQEGGLRLWERHPPQAIAFGPATVKLLALLLETPLGEARPQQWERLADPGPLSSGDTLLLARLLLAVQETPCEAAVATLPAVQGSALCWWLAPGALALHGGPPAALPALDLTAGTFTRLAVEALQPLAAKSWVALERRKRQESSTEAMISAGLGQEASLQAFLKACEKAHARGLATCLIEAACELVARGPLGGAALAAGLDSNAPLRERLKARQAGGALLRAVLHLRTWDAEHRTVRFIDEGYDEAQRLVRAWEALGDGGFRAVEAAWEQLSAAL